jgi:hypothetical protein
MSTKKLCQIHTHEFKAEAGASVPELCREHDMSSATFYKFTNGAPSLAVWKHPCGPFEKARNGKCTAQKDVPKGIIICRGAA